MCSGKCVFVGAGAHRPEPGALAQVMKWSDGSYLEDQDMWRLPGLHRYRHARGARRFHVMSALHAAASLHRKTVTVSSPWMNSVGRQESLRRPAVRPASHAPSPTLSSQERVCPAQARYPYH